MPNTFNILFVDDEPNLLEALRLLLRPMQSTLHIYYATSGKLALEHLAERYFDVVVSDIRMPGMDGIQLLKEVHARSPRTACIVLSGNATEEEVKTQIGFDVDYLAKPSSAQSIVFAIIKALGPA